MKILSWVFKWQDHLKKVSISLWVWLLAATCYLNHTCKISGKNQLTALVICIGQATFVHLKANLTSRLLSVDWWNNAAIWTSMLSLNAAVLKVPAHLWNCFLFVVFSVHYNLDYFKSRVNMHMRMQTSGWLSLGWILQKNEFTLGKFLDKFSNQTTFLWRCFYVLFVSSHYFVPYFYIFQFMKNTVLPVDEYVYNWYLQNILSRKYRCKKYTTGSIFR